MTRYQRQQHLQKRNDLAKKGVNFSKTHYKKKAYRAYFTSAKTRPILKTMPNSVKTNYLKALIARAKLRSIEVHREIRPEICKISPFTIKNGRNKQHLLNFQQFHKIHNFNKKTELIVRLAPKKVTRIKHG